jgi:hypothetical protein
MKRGIISLNIQKSVGGFERLPKKQKLAESWWF